MITLFAGSRNATGEMLDYTDYLVKNAINFESRIWVGDNNLGIDNKVIEICRLFNYRHVLVWYCTSYPRNGGVEYGSMRHVSTTSHKRPDMFIERDKTMIDSLVHHVNHHAYFISNSNAQYASRKTGTSLGFDYAKSLKLNATKISFER